MSWIPERVELRRIEPLGFKRTGESWPAGTSAKATELDTIGAPIDVRRREARQLLQAAGDTPGPNDVLVKPITYRKTRQLPEVGR